VGLIISSSRFFFLSSLCGRSESSEEETNKGPDSNVGAEEESVDLRRGWHLFSVLAVKAHKSTVEFRISELSQNGREIWWGQNKPFLGLQEPKNSGLRSNNNVFFSLWRGIQSERERKWLPQKERGIFPHNSNLFKGEVGVEEKIRTRVEGGEILFRPGDSSFVVPLSLVSLDLVFPKQNKTKKKKKKKKNRKAGRVRKLEPKVRKWNETNEMDCQVWGWGLGFYQPMGKFPIHQ